jgi:hemerythrin-like domain-containing protein
LIGVSTLSKTTPGGAAFGMQFAALPAAAERHDDIVDGIKRRVGRIVIVPRHHHLGDDLFALHRVAADEGRAGIAAVELAVLSREHDTATVAARRLERELVESLQQQSGHPALEKHHAPARFVSGGFSSQ